METFKTSPADRGLAYRQIATAAIAAEDAVANFVFIVRAMLILCLMLKLAVSELPKQVTSYSSPP
jgi:hypothetical protein